ncbi:MAG TPA: hypothetical protein VF993_15945 [Myxococcales bacterium]
MPVIDVVDFSSGRKCGRPRDTLTLDVPADLPREGFVEVGDGLRGSYLAASGNHVLYNASPRPLSWRAPGELCLVARSGGASRRMRQYRLCTEARP